MERVRKALLGIMTDISLESEEYSNPEAELTWEFASNRWDSGSRVSQWYSGQEVAGSSIDAVVTIYFAGASRSAVERQNPARALAFRGPIRVKVEDLTVAEKSGPAVVATLVYLLAFWTIERFQEDIALDQQALAAWLESDPEDVPREIFSATVEAAT